MQLCRHCYCWAYARRALHSHWLGVCSACTLAASLGVCSTRHMAGWARCSAGQLGIGRCARPQKKFLLPPTIFKNTVARCRDVYCCCWYTIPFNFCVVTYTASSCVIVCAGRAFRHGTPLLVAILGTHRQMSFTLYFKPVSSSTTTTTTGNSSSTISKAAVG